MKISEAQKRGTKKWDRANMHSLSCRVRTNEAEKFKKYCAQKNTTPYNVLKEYIFSCIGEMEKTDLKERICGK